MRVKGMNRIFKFFTIKYWKDYIRFRHILKCIKNAKVNFLLDRSKSNNILNGLCYYLGEELFGNINSFKDLFINKNSHKKTSVKKQLRLSTI